MELRLTEQEALALYRIILRWDESGSLTVGRGELLLRSLSGVVCTTPDTSKSQPTAYCFAQLKQGTCLIRLN